MPLKPSYKWLSMESLMEERPIRFQKKGFEWHCIKVLEEVRRDGWQFDYGDVTFENNQPFRAVLNAEFYSDFNCRINCGAGGVARAAYSHFLCQEEGMFVAGIIENWDDILILPRQLRWGDRRADIARAESDGGWYYAHRDQSTRYGPVLFYIKSWSGGHEDDEWDLLEEVIDADQRESSVSHHDDDDDDDGDDDEYDNVSEIPDDDDDDDDDDDGIAVGVEISSENASKKMKLMANCNE